MKPTLTRGADGYLRNEADQIVDSLGIPYTPRDLPQQPARSLLRGTFDYTSSADTDIRKTIKRAKKEQTRALVAEYIIDDLPATPAKLLPFNSTRKVNNA